MGTAVWIADQLGVDYYFNHPAAVVTSHEEYKNTIFIRGSGSGGRAVAWLATRKVAGSIARWPLS